MALYYLGIRIYYTLILLYSLFNPKAKRFINGRKNWEKKYQDHFQKLEKPVLWMHCASVGEFEQGRVLLENLGHLKSDYFILLTFFSPSGYELRQNYAYADSVQYLPLDLPGTAQRFIAIVKPKLALFVKYEIWLGYFSALKKQGIATYLICAKFRADQIYFKWYAKIYKTALANIDLIFVQTTSDAVILNRYDLDNFTVSGDLRYERVLSIQALPYQNQIIENFIQSDHLILMAGSTWWPDENLLIDYLKKSKAEHQAVQLIIAPHEIEASHLNKLCMHIQSQSFTYQLYSQVKMDEKIPNDILIIDSIGELSKLYRYGHISYVGGGFGKGIHNVLEPAVYGSPVFFGPKHEKFAEALLLKENKCAFSIETSEALFQNIKNLTQQTQHLEVIKNKLSQIFEQNKHSLKIIKTTIFEKKDSLNI